MTNELREMIGQAVEAPLHPDQKRIERAILATLAKVINSDVSDLKYDILRMSIADFHFQDHRDVFAAMKGLADEGDHVDDVTVGKKLKAEWADARKAIFDGDLADEGQVRTYMKTVIGMANYGQAVRIGADFMDAVKKSDHEDIPALVADLQRAVFDIEKTKRIIPPTLTEAEHLADFITELENQQDGYDTGFPKLNDLIKGLKPGLFVIAAAPSAGKTTFVKQLADQVADKSQAPVLFFSYEQSAAELRIKTLSRLSKINNEILRKGLVGGGEGGANAMLSAAVEEYKRFGRHIKIIEGDRHHTIGAIRLMAQREKMMTKKAPLIVLDFLQIVPVMDANLRDRREKLDYLVSELRRLARDLETPIVAISAMSRAEYDKSRMSAFKESGGIEYGTDIAAIMKVDDEDKDGTERNVSLAIIKNRNGRRGKIKLTYRMSNDTFEETSFENMGYLESIGDDNDND